MKFKVGDRVLVTAGKDKGKKSVIVALLPKENKVVVKDVNMYYKHVKPFMDRPGEKARRERAMDVAKIAVLNDQDQVDRLAYRVTEAGKKERIFKKTGKVAKVEQVEKAVKAEAKAKKRSSSAKAGKVTVSSKAAEAIEADKKAAQKASVKASKMTRVRKTQDKG